MSEKFTPGATRRKGAAATTKGGAAAGKSGKPEAEIDANNLTTHRTAAAYIDPRRLAPAAAGRGGSGGDDGSLTWQNAWRHPYVTFAMPLVFLSILFSAIQLLATRAAEPVFGNVLAYKNVDLVAAFCLFPAWMGTRGYLNWANRRHARKAGNAAFIASSGLTSLAPARIDAIFHAALRALAFAALCIAISPAARDATLRFAHSPRHGLDHLLAPVAAFFAPELASVQPATTTVLALLPAAISVPLADLLARYGDTAAPAWVHPHLFFALTLYPVSLVVGGAVSAFPYVTATPYTAPSVLERHFKFARLVVPIIWFVFANISKAICGYLVETLYPDTSLAVVAGVLALLCGFVIPLAYPPYTATRGKYIHTAIATVALGFVVQSLFFSRHTVRVIEQPIALNNEYTLLEKRGHVQVLADSARDVLFLRAGHSLLGGTYRSSGDSVFSGFYYHDLHRLAVNRTIETDPAATRGLMIGYGVGTAASSYVTSGIPLDVVEIDAPVLEIARRYFELPKTPAGDDADIYWHIGDGRDFVERTRGGTYDFVIHDVFTGGSLPEPMFTYATFAHIRRVLKPGGTLSVNFVGKPHSLPFRYVAKTLRAVFPYLRCFAERSEHDADGPNDSGLTNLVFFASTAPIVFRDPAEHDYFGSAMRWFALSRTAELEIPLPGPPGVTADPLLQTTPEDLYYEWHFDSEKRALTIPDAEFSDPTVDPPSGLTGSSSASSSKTKVEPGREIRGRGLKYKLPATVRADPPQVDKALKSNAEIPRIVLDKEPGKLSGLLFDVAVAHYEIMHKVIPLDIWLEY
ncbi:hypothetical protein H9P43_003472 [Blastocladiella emersonii ATCC 22665]|nr:hypothetical protein H9P43_003472 [Blastocladiella emersonii ATCC 22665]